MTSPTTARLQSAALQQLAELPAKDLLATEPMQVTLRGITDGSVAGTTNDAVLRFDSANDVQLGDASWATIAHDAVGGDSVALNKRGVYHAVLVFSQAASNEARLGISADVAAAGLTGLPAMGTAGMLKVGGALLPAATAAYSSVETFVLVSEAEAKAGKVIRAHGTVAAGSVIQDASIAQNADCMLQITRIGDLIS